MNLENLENKDIDLENKDIDYVKINLASPQRIQQWAERILPNGQIVGEVTIPDTLNYRSLKPEMNGLFCERTFGPVKSGHCQCGKHKHAQAQGLVCESCGVELTHARIRRHRMGYIALLTPVTHVWYFKGVPSYLANVLDLPRQHLEQTVYYSEPDDTSPMSLPATFVQRLRRLTDPEKVEEEIKVFQQKTGSQKVGAEILYERLKKIDLYDAIQDCRWSTRYEGRQDKRKKAMRRLRIFESFLLTDSKPEWMILTVLPVLPPALRPMVQLEGGRFAASDLNDLYRRVIIRNNRLLRILKASSLMSVIRTEKRLIQEAVDVLIDNGKQGPKAVDLHNRPLKSLADTIEGKEGRFRQNLLGKRADYSGRSVIVVGPHLALYQCGLPYEMALELFYPFIAHQLLEQGQTASIRRAKTIIENQPPFLWPLVKELIKNHPVLLNRAPTLHRLGVQAFEPVLIHQRTIQLHPLVCPAFNADFDGDQMAVHVPLSLEAQTEARILMLAPNNFLSPATGEPMIQPTQDMLIGCYYLSLINRSCLKAANRYFRHFDDVLVAYHKKEIDLHSSIWLRCPDHYHLGQQGEPRKKLCLPDGSRLSFYENLQCREDKTGVLQSQYLRTTAGRVIFNQVLNSLDFSEKIE